MKVKKVMVIKTEENNKVEILDFKFFAMFSKERITGR